jgi:tetratricopeptide (TPR) repeat protein
MESCEKTSEGIGCFLGHRFLLKVFLYESSSARTATGMKNWKLQLAAVAVVLSGSARGQASSPAQAIALEQQGKLAEAAQVWRAVTERNPKDAAAFASLGVVLSKEQKYPEAASAYKKAIALNSKLPGVQLNLGLAEFKQGHFEAAIPPLTAASNVEPKNMQARTLLGLSCYGAKRYAEAIEHLKIAARSDPGNTELHQVLAQSCLSAKQYSCALDEFRKILEQNPDSSAAHVLTGEALDGLGKTPDAIAEFQAAAKVAPREATIHFGLGYLYWKSHQYDEAKREFENELSVDSSHAQALAYLGDIEMKRNNPEAALSLLTKATKLKDDIRIAYLDTGTILAQQKRYDEAVAAFQQAVKLDPAQPDAHYRLAHVYHAMGKAEESQNEFAKVRELHEKADEPLASKMAATPPPLPQ